MFWLGLIAGFALALVAMFLFLKYGPDFIGPKL